MKMFFASVYKTRKFLKQLSVVFFLIVKCFCSDNRGEGQPYTSTCTYNLTCASPYETCGRFTVDTENGTVTTRKGDSDKTIVFKWNGKSNVQNGEAEGGCNVQNEQAVVLENVTVWDSGNAYLRSIRLSAPGTTQVLQRFLQDMITLDHTYRSKNGITVSNTPGGPNHQEVCQDEDCGELFWTNKADQSLCDTCHLLNGQAGAVLPQSHRNHRDDLELLEQQREKNATKSRESEEDLLYEVCNSGTPGNIPGEICIPGGKKVPPPPPMGSTPGETNIPGVKKVVKVPPPGEKNTPGEIHIPGVKKVRSPRPIKNVSSSKRECSDPDCKTKFSSFSKEEIIFCAKCTKKENNITKLLEIVGKRKHVNTLLAAVKRREQLAAERNKKALSKCRLVEKYRLAD